jgi:hypothetical protein
MAGQAWMKRMMRMFIRIATTMRAHIKAARGKRRSPIRIIWLFLLFNIIPEYPISLKSEAGFSKH